MPCSSLLPSAEQRAHRRACDQETEAAWLWSTQPAAATSAAAGPAYAAEASVPPPLPVRADDEWVQEHEVRRGAADLLREFAEEEERRLLAKAQAHRRR